MSLGRVRAADCAERGPRGRTDLARGQAGRRSRRLRQLLSRGSVNWLVREARSASPPAGRLASTHSHPHPTQASRRTHTHTYTHTLTHTPPGTHSHKARPPRDSAIRARRLAAEATRRPLAPRPGGRSLPPRAAPAALPAPAAAARPAASAPGLAPGCSVDPHSQPSPALRPPLGCRPEQGRPLRPPRRGPAHWRGGLRGAGAQTAQAPGSAPLGDRGVATRGASAAALLQLLGFGALAGAAGEGAPGRAKEAARTPASFFLRLFSFLLAPRSTSQQLPHPQTPAP